MIYCANCGKEVPQDSKFCTYCGAQIVADTTNISGKRVVTNQHAVSTTSNFFRSPAFWGSILVMVGFFLPWFKNGENLSGFTIVTQQYSPAKLLLILFPFCALYTLIDTISGFLPGRAGGFFRFLPFILVVIYVALFLSGYKNSSTLNSAHLKDLLNQMSIGIWFILIGSIFMLFHFSKSRR